MQVMITGHAGCEGGRANSLDGINLALHSAADCLEVDCRLRGDVLVLSHDEMEENRDYVTLAEVISIITGAGKTLNCDLKEKSVFGPCLDLIRNKKVEDRVFFSGSVPLADLPEKGRFQVYLNAELLLQETGVPAVQAEIEQIRNLYEDGQKGEAEARLIAFAANRLDLVAKAFEQYKDYETVAGLNLDYRWLQGLPPDRTPLKDTPLSLWTVDDPLQLETFFAGSGTLVNITTNCPNLAGKLLAKVRS